MPDRAGPERDRDDEQEGRDGERPRGARREGVGRDERVQPGQRRPASASGIAGRVITSGRSRWSRSVARSSVRAAKKAPKIARAARLVEAQGERAQRHAAEDHDDRRPPVDRPDPAGRPDDRARLVELGLVGRPAGRDPVGREPPRRHPSDAPRTDGQDGAAPRASGPRPGRARRASRSTRRSRRGRPTACALRKYGRAGDVEVDPRHRDELAQEERAADQAALGRRARVRHVRVPAVHLLPSTPRRGAAARAARRPGRPAAATSSYQAWGAPNPPVTRWPKARATAPVSVATSTTWVAPEALRVGHRVAQDEAPLRVRVDDVHRLAVEGGHDVARAGGVRARACSRRPGRRPGAACREPGGRRSRRRRARCTPPSCPSSSPPSGRPA